MDITTNTHLNTTKEIGYAVEIKDYFVLVDGLPHVKANELVITEQKARGMVYGLSKNHVQILMLDDLPVRFKETFYRTEQQFSIQASEALFNRTINPLGIPIDGKGKITSIGEMVPIDRQALGISAREFIREQFVTGVTTVDMLIPLAKGQRELILGDARAGKTSFIVDILVNQKNLGSKMLVVLALIGKPVIEIRRLISVLEANGVMDFVTVVAASSSDKPPMIYLTPYVASTIAEHFQREKGRDVLLILDDLGLHAKYYREISLLSDKAPGRESYPGDIFYQHARLLERAGKFNKQNGGGSITALPVMETAADDITGFLQTNLMGMTDGHLLFNSSLYHRGTRPAVDISLSVSRVGKQTQNLVQKQLADKVKGVLAHSEKFETLSRFGSDLSEETRLVLNQGHVIKELLHQERLVNIPKIMQIILLGLVFTPYLRSKPVEYIKKNKAGIMQFLSKYNLKEMENQVEKMKDAEQFIQSLTSLAQELEKAIR